MLRTTGLLQDLYMLKQNNMDLKTCYIELIENYPCECKEELVAREGYLIKQIGTLNALISGRTQREYYKDNKTTTPNNK